LGFLGAGFFALGVNGSGFIFSRVRKTSSSLEDFAMPKPRGAYTKSDSLDHAPDIAKAIGDMVVAWSAAEQGLVSVLTIITGTGYGMAATTYYSMPAFDGRVRLIKNLLRVDCEQTPEVDALLKAIEGLRGLSGTRNSYIHGDWAVSLDRKETVIFNHMELLGTPGRKKTVRASDIIDHSKAVSRRRVAIRDAFDRAFPPKPGKPRVEAPKPGHQKTQKG
jgi:hypothetical protein